MGTEKVKPVKLIMRRWGLFALLCLALCVAVPVLSQTDADPYANIPQSDDLEGFPQIGFPSALINVIIYAAFDDLGSAVFWQESYTPLVPRIQAGEILVSFVPLFGRGDLEGGRGAARAALCAGDQAQFWAYQDRLFSAVLAQGSSALAGDSLLTIGQALGLDMGQWTNCVTSDAPDGILTEAERAVTMEQFFTRTPFVKVGDAPSLTDIESLNFTIDQQLGVANDELAQDFITPTPDPEATPEAEVIELDALTGDSIAPPLTITLPDGWQMGSDILVLQDVDAIRNVPFTVYTGPVTGGTGTIVLLWGIPNLVIASARDALSGQPVQPDLYTDGTRLLRLAIVEEGCNVGTDLRQTYNVGGLSAVGTQFAAVDCPELPDTRGWFAGVRQFDLNFIFYVYSDPIEAVDSARPELETILESIRFVLPATATPAP